MFTACNVYTMCNVCAVCDVCNVGNVLDLCNVCNLCCCHVSLLGAALQNRYHHYRIFSVVCFVLTCSTGVCHGSTRGISYMIQVLNAHASAHGLCID